MLWYLLVYSNRASTTCSVSHGIIPLTPISYLFHQRDRVDLVRRLSALDRAIVQRVERHAARDQVRVIDRARFMTDYHRYSPPHHHVGTQQCKRSEEFNVLIGIFMVGSCAVR